MMAFFFCLQTKIRFSTCVKNDSPVNHFSYKVIQGHEKKQLFKTSFHRRKNKGFCLVFFFFQIQQNKLIFLGKTFFFLGEKKKNFSIWCGPAQKDTMLKEKKKTTSVFGVDKLKKIQC